MESIAALGTRHTRSIDWHSHRAGPDAWRVGGEQVDDSVGAQGGRHERAGLQGHHARLVGAGGGAGKLLPRANRRVARTTACLCHHQCRRHRPDHTDVSRHRATASVVSADCVCAGLRRRTVLRLAAVVSAGVSPPSVPRAAASLRMLAGSPQSWVSWPRLGCSPALGGSYPKVGATCGLICLLGLIVIWWEPDTTDNNLDA